MANSTKTELKVLNEFLNESDEFLFKYGLPALFFIGTPANLFAFISILYRRLYAKSQMFVFFAFMTATDTIRVGTECGEAFVRSWVYTYYLKIEDTYTIHGWSIVISRYFGDSAMLASAWTVVLANAYKLYGLLRPLHVKASDKKIAFWSCVAVLVYCYSTNVIILLGYRVLPFDIGNNTRYMTIGFLESYAPFILNYFYPYSLAFYSLIPGVILLLLSIAILITFWRLYKKHLSMTRQGTSDSSTYKTAKTSIMALLPLSVVHVSFTLPGVIEIINMQLLNFSNVYFLLWSINHSINVYVQMVCSKFYRDSILGRK